MSTEYRSVAGVGFMVTPEQITAAVEKVADALPVDTLDAYRDGSYGLSELNDVEAFRNTLLRSDLHPDIRTTIEIVGNMYALKEDKRAYFVSLANKTSTQECGEQNPGAVIPYFSITDKEIEALIELAARFNVIESVEDPEAYIKVGFVHSGYIG